MTQPLQTFPSQNPLLPHNAPLHNPMAICGLDEAGRGPLAGPIIAAGVILPPGFDFAARFPKVRFGDSKQMTALQRNKAFDLIAQNALAYKIMQIDVPEINARGIGWANRAIFERLIMAIQADYYIVDGNLKLELPLERWGKVESRIRADQSVAVVSAASILAKVTRDRLMEGLHIQHPYYNWKRNHGYGTREHIRALRDNGLTDQHRVQFCMTALSEKQRRA